MMSIAVAPGLGKAGVNGASEVKELAHYCGPHNLNGGPSWVAGNATGHGFHGQAINFDHTAGDECIRLSQPAKRIATGCPVATFFIRVKLPDTAGNPWMLGFESSGGWGLRTNAGDSFQIYDGAAWRTYNATDPDDGAWHAWAWTYEDVGDLGDWWFDGTMVQQRTDVGATTLGGGTQSGPGALMCHANLGDDISGDLACFYFWRRKLRPAEIQLLSLDPYAMFRRRYDGSIFKAAAGEPVTAKTGRFGRFGGMLGHDRGMFKGTTVVGG
jgi:hypothetical protein